MEKKCKKAKWLSEEALQIAVKRREAKSRGEKERYIHLKAEFQRIARRDKKAFLSDHCKDLEENNRMGRTRDLFKMIRDTKGTFHAKMGTINDRNSMDLKKQETSLVAQMAKASTYSAGDLGSIPGSERCPGEGNGNLLQYSCLENPMDGGACRARIHGVTNSQTQLSDFAFFLSNRSRRY